MGRGFLDGFAVDTAAITAPGMVSRGRFGQPDMAIEGFAIHDFGLLGRFVEDGVGQGFVFVEDGNFSIGILADGDLSIAQGVAGAVRLDLVDDPVGLHGQVLGERADFLAGQDQVQVFCFEQRAVCIVVAAWLNCKATIEVFPELWQEGIGRVNVGDTLQTQLLHQAILEGLIGTLNPAFGLRTIRTDDLDVQFLHRPSKLGNAVAQTTGLLSIDPKDAVFVAVEGHWLPIPLKIMP